MNAVAMALAGHLIGDWLVQTDRQASEKATSWVANQRHVLGYHLALALTLVWALPWEHLIVVLVVSWITHSIIDRRWPVRWLMAHTGSRPFSGKMWGILVVDQALHISILMVLVAPA